MFFENNFDAVALQEFNHCMFHLCLLARVQYNNETANNSPINVFIVLPFGVVTHL